MKNLKKRLLAVAAGLFIFMACQNQDIEPNNDISNLSSLTEIGQVGYATAMVGTSVAKAVDQIWVSIFD